MTDQIVGIDFGTSASAVAVMENGQPVIIPNRRGEKLTPSVVAFTNQGQVLVGTPAVSQAATNPERTIFSIKTQLGRPSSTGWPLVVDGMTYTPVDIAAFIFESLKQDAENYLDQEVTEAVVAVPAYFNHSQRQAVKEAAQKAGFTVRRLVAEPTAAALLYGIETQYSDKIIAIYDLGGGSFDISVLEIDRGLVDVKAVNGNTTLGGDDFDHKIMDYLIDEFKKQSGILLSTNKSAKIRLKQAVEQAKIDLSILQMAKIHIPYIWTDQNGSQHLDIDLSRTQFEELTGDLVEQTLECCRQALQDARLEAAQIDSIILIGLSTKIPLVRQLIFEWWQKQPRLSLAADEAVALGAAIQGGILSGRGILDHKLEKALLLDVMPMSLGLETVNNVMTRIVPRNTTIPTTKAAILTTAFDNQTKMQIHVLQGEQPLASDNETLGRFVIHHIPPGPRDVPQIEVRFDLNADGLLVVTARDKATGKITRRSFETQVWEHIPLPRSTQVLSVVDWLPKVFEKNAQIKGLSEAKGV